MLSVYMEHRFEFTHFLYENSCQQLELDVKL
jgi:hypothetical protein